MCARVRQVERLGFLPAGRTELCMSSSDIDDEEAERLRSVAVDSASIAGVAAALCEKKKKKKKEEDHHACSDEEAAAPALKFYQARARDVLHKYLDKTFEIKPVNCEGMEAQSHFGEVASDTGFHLFRSAPSGLSEKRHRQEAVSRRERKLQNNHVDEDSLMFESSLLAAAVDGMAVKLHAENAKAKAFALWVLHQAEENEAKRKEEERVALLKAQRGEQWLPSVARDMQLGNSSGGNIPMKVGSVYTQNNAKSNAPDSQPHSSLNIEVKKKKKKKKKKKSKPEVAAAT